jgi:DNA-binding transcriptional regulator YdaS (Cro superfamily)
MDKLVSFMHLNGVSQMQLASSLGVSQALVSQWLSGGRQITPEDARNLCEYSKWQIRPHDLRPDIWPNPTDALPRRAA